MPVNMEDTIAQVDKTVFKFSELWRLLTGISGDLEAAATSVVTRGNCGDEQHSV